MAGILAPSEHTNIASKLIDIRKARKEFKDEWLVNMTMTNFRASTDTTRVIISVFLYHMIATPGLQDRLHKEVDQARRAGLSDPPQFAERQTLPLMEAVLAESHRLHSSLGHHLPQVVPDGGITIEGTYLPAGVCDLIDNN